MYSLRRGNSSHGADAHLQAFVSGPARALRSRDMGTVQANGHKMLTEGERDYIMKTPKFASSSSLMCNTNRAECGSQGR